MPRTTLAYALYQQLPPAWRYRLKEVLGARGHRSNFLNALKSKKDALGKRRLDRVVGISTKALRSAGVESLKGKHMLDFGPGYLIADSLCFYLLGAGRVTAVDLNPIAVDNHLSLAFANTDWDVFQREAFALFPDAAAGFDERRAKLGKALMRGFAGLAEIGITYRAPHDYAVQTLGGGVDIIYSASVLEHLPPELSGKILANLYADLNPGGMMVHLIGFEDHIDLEGTPYAFLAADTDYILARDFDGRGNRIRIDGWKKICVEAKLPARFIDPFYRTDVPRPHPLLPEFANADPKDVFASWVTLVAKKPSA